MARIVPPGEPTPGRIHDCGDELRLLGDIHTLGTVVQCSCGAYFAWRTTNLWQDLFNAVGPGNYKMGYRYWAAIGRVPQ